MSKPVFCACGAIIGVLPSLHVSMDIEFGTRTCKKQGSHLVPKRDEKLYLFGCLKEVTIFYPETGTTSHYFEYIGPKNGTVRWLIHLVATTLGEVPSAKIHGIR